ncbi:hypothetical protein ILUMI_01756 [Ignelater luminosus]|uniref:Uncharacterized protein n=1 Tax=Ignelater luminosus TaxID=2038154 RepID=A0A8K0DEQ5_IGNLU|nr:hypothetical protein ILUMI_01756 [Ignelater luminosus]
MHPIYSPEYSEEEYIQKIQKMITKLELDAMEKLRRVHPNMTCPKDLAPWDESPFHYPISVPREPTVYTYQLYDPKKPNDVLPPGRLTEDSVVIDHMKAIRKSGQQPTLASLPIPTTEPHPTADQQRSQRAITRSFARAMKQAQQCDTCAKSSISVHSYKAASTQDDGFRTNASSLWSPSELYSKRRIRVKLDLLKPSTKSHAKPTRARQLSVGDRVQARRYPARKPTWRLGTITLKFGKLHYHVNLDSESYCLERHYNQLLRVIVNNPQPKKVTFSPLPPLTVPLTLPMNEPNQLQTKPAEPPDQLQPEPAEVSESQPFLRPIPRRSEETSRLKYSQGDVRNKFVVNAMRKNRFLTINRFIHCADNHNPKEGSPISLLQNDFLKKKCRGSYGYQLDKEEGIKVVKWVDVN